MPRARIDRNGIAIAKAGFDVDTASPAEMTFHPSFVAARLFMRGTLAVGNYTGTGDNIYRRGTVSFGKTFARPPVVIVGGVRSDGGLTMTPFLQTFFSPQNSLGQITPHYSVEIGTSSFTLYVKRNDPSNGFYGPVETSWRYWVLENTLDA